MRSVTLRSGIDKEAGMIRFVIGVVLILAALCGAIVIEGDLR